MINIIKNLQLNHCRCFLILTILLFVSCGKKHNPLKSEEFEFPPAPQDLQASIGDGEIELTWTMEDTNEVVQYFIYRVAQETEQAVLLDSVVINRYVVRNISNGIEYTFQVSAINKDGVEGPKSQSISAVPNTFFGVIIEDGKEYTNTKNVTLTITAPQGISLMKITNDTSFSSSEWESFVTTRVWEIEAEEDGRKFVYVKFQDAEGNETINPAKDDIILDTKVQIVQFDVRSNNHVLVPGDTLHITMDAQETDGIATFDIGDTRQNIQLNDNGISGDELEDDGIYELDYIILPGLEVENAEVIGHFEDIAGNLASPVSAIKKVTIQYEPPTAVSLYDPLEITYSSVSLQWTANFDNDFASYSIFRSMSPGVTNTSSLISIITDQEVTGYIDEGLQENTIYYYKVFTYDKFKLFSESNEIKVTTLNNEAPAPVILSQPVLQDDQEIKLTWSLSSEEDFASYRIYRSVVSPVDTSKAPIVIINDPATTEYLDTGLVVGLNYFYVILVYDQLGLSSISNEVSIRITSN